MKFICCYFKRHLFGSFALFAAFLLTACASLEDNLTGVPVGSISHYSKGVAITKFTVNGRTAGSNCSGGNGGVTTQIVLEKDFAGPLTLDVKWEICNFRHYLKDKQEKNSYCIEESYEAKVPVHVVDTPAGDAFLYLHFFNDNSVEAWMSKFYPESKNYPGPAFPDTE